MTVRESSLLAMKLADMLNGVSRVVRVAAPSSGRDHQSGAGLGRKTKGRKARANSVHIVSSWGSLTTPEFCITTQNNVRIDSAYEASSVA